MPMDWALPSVVLPETSCSRGPVPSSQSQAWARLQGGVCSNSFLWYLVALWEFTPLLSLPTLPVLHMEWKDLVKPDENPFLS